MSPTANAKADGNVPPKYKVGARVHVKHHDDADYSHGKITFINTDHGDAKYVVSFNPEDELENTTYEFNWSPDAPHFLTEKKKIPLLIVDQ